MILGMSISTFTTLHVILSLIGILSGFAVLFGMLGKIVAGAFAIRNCCGTAGAGL